MIGISKQQQLYKNKEPKAKTKKSKITQHEREYLEWLQLYHYPRCFVCYTQANIEYHHVKLKSTDKKRHTVLISLCKNHHTGNEISPHGTPKQWREKYTMQEQETFAREMYNKFLEDKRFNNEN